MGINRYIVKGNLVVKASKVSLYIYANSITENVDLIPNVLYNGDIEFDGTNKFNRRCYYVYGRTTAGDSRNNPNKR